jgi:predicted Fe-S protein YdhL (DUF1289 family)
MMMKEWLTLGRKHVGAAHGRRVAALLSLVAGCAMLACALCIGCATSAQEAFTGQWLVEPTKQADEVHLTLRYRSWKDRDKNDDEKWHGYNNTTSFDIARANLLGLTPAQMSSTTGNNVHFHLRRDAGTLDCEGWFKDSQGAGHFTFTPDAGFATELARRGVGTPTREQQFQLTLNDAGFALLDELRADGYAQPNVEQFVRMGQHGVRLEYVRNLHALGYDMGTTEALVRMADHGVSTRYIHNLAALGYERLAAEDLVRAADHGVSSEFAAQVQASYGRLPLEQLVRMADHGVGPRFIQEFAELGYRRLTAEELIKFADHGVSTRYVRSLKALGYTDVPADVLVRLADHGVSTSYIEKARARGYSNLSLEQLIYMHDRGELN